MYRRGLKSAVTKLEARQKPRQFRWPVIIAQYPEEGCGEIIGLKIGNKSYKRLASENDLATFSSRIQSIGPKSPRLIFPLIVIAVYND